jgi:hypothetical protein
MDINDVKLKVMDLISEASASLQPKENHVFGNWHIATWEKTGNFPVVTVRLKVTNQPVYGNRLQRNNVGQRYVYDMTFWIQADSMESSRALMDEIIDYLFLNNKQSSINTEGLASNINIVDITNFQPKEAIVQHGPHRYWRMQIDCKVTTEETLS